MATPFREDGGCDIVTLIAHARSRLVAGCSSVTLFGTTGEGASLSTAERAAVLAALEPGGLRAAEQVIVGICACAVDEAAAQIRMGQAHGVQSFLLLPPFYFKGVRDDGLYQWYRQLFLAIGGNGAQIYLYHIPSVSEVPVPIELVERLNAEFPQLVKGVKDSSGDWSYSSRLLQLAGRLTVLIGDERHLARAVALGAEGAISGAANVFPELLLPLVNEAREDPRVNRMVDEILRYPVVPAVKTLLAHRTANKAWLRAAPPLSALHDDEARRLIASYEDIIGRS